MLIGAIPWLILAVVVVPLVVVAFFLTRRKSAAMPEVDAAEAEREFAAAEVFEAEWHKGARSDSTKNDCPSSLAALKGAPRTEAALRLAEARQRAFPVTLAPPSRK
jgi:hypothetical protein